MGPAVVMDIHQLSQAKSGGPWEREAEGSQALIGPPNGGAEPQISEQCQDSQPGGAVQTGQERKPQRKTMDQNPFLDTSIGITFVPTQELM